MEITIREDDPRRPEIAELLTLHVTSARAQSPPESAHALDIEGLCAADVTFWAAWDETCVLGFGALKELTSGHGEIKSMHTVAAQRGRGVGARILAHIVAEARRRGYERLSLETGSMEFFAPARALYARAGFRPCAPFASYREDPNSVYMTLDLPTSPFPG